tara:strand:+ start:189 stop:539 length:351 start_codon:yes stop_codon:yes gene_type:complete
VVLKRTRFMRIYIFVATLLVLLSVSIIPSCGEREIPKKSDGSIDGKKVYEANCVSCHGANGDMGGGGAYDLSTSTLSKEEKIDVVTNGRKAMMPYKKMLTKGEIEAVVEYTETLKK